MLNRGSLVQQEISVAVFDPSKERETQIEAAIAKKRLVKTQEQVWRVSEACP
jgi:hypothetical protein